VALCHVKLSVKLTVTNPAPASNRKGKYSSNHQFSGATVVARNPKQPPDMVLKLCKLTGMFTISTGYRRIFEPSTVGYWDVRPLYLVTG